MSHRTFLFAFVLLPVSPFIVVALWIIVAVVRGLVLQFAGYPVDIAPWELARQMYELGQGVERCYALQQSAPSMGPSLDEKRAHCVYEYASLTRDPKVCELLMPSDYGLSCVGKVLAKADDDDRQSYWCSADADVLRCYGRDNGYDRGIDYGQCESLPKSSVERDWCFVGRYWNRMDESACDSVYDVKAKDACISVKANRTGDESLCDAVDNSVHRSACHVLLGTFRKYPELQQK